MSTDRDDSAQESQTGPTAPAPVDPREPKPPSYERLEQPTAGSASGGDGTDTEDVANEPEEVHPAPSRPRHPPKRPLAEIFAESLGYQKDGEVGRYFYDDGSWLQRGDGGLFHLQRYDASGQLVQSYWVKDHCLEKEPLKLSAEVWRLCQDFPSAYTLVVTGPDGRPVEFAGTRLAKLASEGVLRLYPAEYRIALEHELT